MLYSSRNRGFSLTELLIVSVILMVVLGALIGVAGSVRGTSDLARCTGNLRSLHMAHAQYLTEHHRNFTSARWDLASTHASTPGLRDYLGLTGLERHATALTCPAVQRTEQASGRWMAMNYGINTRATRGYHTSSLESARGVLEPARFLLFTEGVVNPTSSSDVKEGSNYFVAVSWAQVTQMQWVHGGAQNVVFLDGHMKLLQASDFPGGSSAFRQPLWSGSEPLQ